jgi:hypothetical protein
MADEQTRASRIAQFNDEFRQQAGLALAGRRCAPGQCVMTAGIAALDIRAQTEIFARVRQFSTFERGNDPYGEHDFGTVLAPGGEQVFWKIDYFADDAMEYGAEDPADPTRSYRVLTVMLAAEY